MNDYELLLAISDIVRKNSKRLEKRIDRLDEKIDCVEERLSARIDAVDAKIDAVDNRLSNEIRLLKLDMENFYKPCMKELLAYQKSVYERYMNEADKIETLEMNVSVIKSVMKEYGVRIGTLSA